MLNVWCCHQVAVGLGVGSCAIGLALGGFDAALCADSPVLRSNGWTFEQKILFSTTGHGLVETGQRIRLGF
jgi:hypothetical protein